MRQVIRPVLTVLSTIGLLAVTCSPAMAQSGTRTAPPSGSSSRSAAPSGSGQRVQAQASLALEGYCPVSLQKMNKWVKGNPAIQATFDGHTYYFANEARPQMNTDKRGRSKREAKRAKREESRVFAKIRG